MSPGQVNKPHSDPLMRQYDISTLGALKSPRKLVREVLAGLVVALALIPEAISFSIIAGVDPAVGLFSSFIMAVVIAIAGGRTAMISAATGAVALVIAPLMRDYGFDYFIACVLLAGVFQVVFALLGVSKLIRFVPRAVMVGFVNALAILVFMAQMPQLIDVPWVVYPLLAAGIVILWLFPKITGAVLLVLVLVFDQWVAQIPMAALVAVMIMVCIATFDWHSIQPRTLRTLPKSETVVMLVTVAVVLMTSNLAIGVIVGVLTAAVVFVRQVAHVVRVERELQDEEGNVLSADTPADQVAQAVYKVRGALFFGSSNDFTTMFRYGEDPDLVCLDLSQAQVWDASSVAALDSVEATYAEQGKRLVIAGMSEKSRRIHDRLSGELGES